MATNTSQSVTTRALTYLKRARWLHGFLLVEVIFIAGGYGVAQMGTRANTFGQPVDTHLALGGLMGAMAIVFAFITLFFLAVSLTFRVRRRMKPSIEF
ncbi:MAG: hypothetical protein ABEJ42_07770 [Halobacteriaceae archaeon]